MAFQNITPVKLGQAAITTAVTLLYTVPGSTRTFVKNIDVANNNSGPTTLNIYLVPNGGTASSSNILTPGVSVPGNGEYQWSGSQILNAGDTIQVSASATGLTVIASGGEAV